MLASAAAAFAAPLLRVPALPQGLDRRALSRLEVELHRMALDGKVEAVV
jgi:hypothetical protein